MNSFVADLKKVIDKLLVSNVIKPCDRFLKIKVKIIYPLVSSDVFS